MQHCSQAAADRSRRSACRARCRKPARSQRTPSSPDRGWSRRLRATSLLYIAAWPPAVYVYTYPKGQLVGTLTGSAQLFGECTDSAGDVFIVAYSNGSVTSSTIYEYAHGGTSPIATLNDPKTAQGCAVDPQTGNLAASGDGVAIFKNASGNPKMYYSSEYGFYYCSYDNKSNLYLTAANGSTVKAVLVRLASGSASFDQISLIPKLYVAGNIAPTVQWERKTHNGDVGPGAKADLPLSAAHYRQQRHGHQQRNIEQPEERLLRSDVDPGEDYHRGGLRPSRFGCFSLALPQGRRSLSNYKRGGWNTLSSGFCCNGFRRSITEGSKMSLPNFQPLRIRHLHGRCDAVGLRRMAAADRRAGRDATKQRDKMAPTSK